MKFKRVTLLNRKTVWPFLCGLFLIFFLYAPYCFLREKTFFRIHDSLEVDIPYFILNAKYLFAPWQLEIPELFQGAPRGAIQVSSFLAVLLFRILEPITAYIVHFYIVLIYGYSGMYLLTKSVLSCPFKEWVAVGVAISYVLLPYVPSVGLTFMGIPFVTWSVLNLSRYLNCPAWKRNICWCVLLLYGCSSSLVYSGYYVVGSLLLLLGISFFNRKLNSQVIIKQVSLLGICYCITHFYTFYDLLFIQGHRIEWAVKARPFWTSFKSMWLNGDDFSYANQKILIKPAVFTSVFICFLYLINHNRKLIRENIKLTLLISVAYFIALFHAFIKCEYGEKLLESIHLNSFQIDRLYTTYPVIWCLIGGIIISIWLALLDSVHKAFSRIVAIIMTISLVFQAVNSNQLYKENWKRMYHKQSSASISWEDFYDSELLNRIQQYIGIPQEEYYVASLGISPAIALYNGFYCLDGYSVNYYLEYKHQFRKVIEKELEKDADLEEYFDTWGSRCYLFSSELGKGNYFIYSPDEEGIRLELNATKFTEMKGKYILSAVKILNPDDNYLVLLDFFQSERNSRVIYLYENILLKK